MCLESMISTINLLLVLNSDNLFLFQFIEIITLVIFVDLNCFLILLYPIYPSFQWATFFTILHLCQFRRLAPLSCYLIILSILSVLTQLFLDRRWFNLLVLVLLFECLLWRTISINNWFIILSSNVSYRIFIRVNISIHG